MALPESGTQWPPAPFDKVVAATTEAQAWWEGDPGKLAEAAQTAFRNRPSQYAGGLVGLAARTLWGKPQDTGQVSTRLHIPVAADIVAMSASLLFSDPPTFVIPEGAGNDQAKARLDRIMNTAQTHAQLVVAGETCAALGGVFPRIVWDRDVADNAWLDFVDADHAIPEHKWGRLTAVTFWSELPTDDTDTVLRHLQRYEKGRIVHGLYQGDRDNLGRMIPLTEHDDTAGIDVDADGAILTGSDRLAAGYIPNMRPNPAWRADSTLKHLGRSDLSPDVVPLMDSLDDTWTSLIRDVRLARARIIVSADLMDNQGPGKGSLFDPDQEIFTNVGNTIGADGGMSSTIEAHQFKIRVDEHMSVATNLVLEILRRTGYSPITFGLDEGGSAATATEITARERASNTTRTAKGRLWSNELGPLGRTLLEIDAHQFGTKVEIGENVEVDWPPATRESDLQKSRTLQALTAAQAASTETKVRMLHPDWDDQRIEIETAAIMSEQGLGVSDLGALTESDYTMTPPTVGKRLPDDDTKADGTKLDDEDQ